MIILFKKLTLFFKLINNNFKLITFKINQLIKFNNFPTPKLNNLIRILKKHGGPYFVLTSIVFTMVDGKVCNAATHTKSTMRCYICGATSSDFNDLTKERSCNTENMRFGLSLLHARIRFFESILHVAYKLPAMKWRARLTAEEKKLVETRKKAIQTKFREQLGLLVDIPKANFGNTNGGNTNRRFFDEYEKSAEITGIDQNLIYRLKVILDTMCCGIKINIQKFEIYCKETADLYVSLYEFHPMSPT